MRPLSILGMLFAATSLVAQARESCSSGPGAAFGIVAYQCANCGFKNEKPRPSYQFFAEPVVLETSRGSLVNVGDVIEAVNGKPITTSAGAEQFTYPSAGVSSISLRRGRDRQVISVTIPASSACESPASPDARPVRYDLDDIESVEVFKGPAAVARYGASATNGVIVITTKTKPGFARVRLPALVTDTTGGAMRIRVRGAADRQAGATQPIYIIDGFVVDPSNPGASPFGRPATDNARGFGFAVACKTSCPAATATEGMLHYTYYKYDVPPPIVHVRAGSIAERAGLKVGDVLTKVDGHAITDDDGAKILTRLDWADKVRLTVRRDGKEIDYALRLTDKPD